MNRMLLVAVLCTTLAPMAAAEQSPYSRYRELSLGSPVQAVLDQLRAQMVDVKVLHEQPTLIQQLTWRPQRFISGVTLEADPLAEMVLTFHQDRLVRIAVAYDGERTKGMTDDDFREALIARYGPPLLESPGRFAPTQASVNFISRWDDAETRVVLWREPYPDRVKLSFAAIAADQAMQSAIDAGDRLEAAEAPARDRARLAADAAARRAREDAARRENKAAFKP